jgi:hypothetical protein
MLPGLADKIVAARLHNQDNLPRNPQNATYIQAKITLLQTPSLAADIMNGRWWAEASAPSSGGRTISVAAVFPQASMREEAAATVAEAVRVLSLLEEFMATPFPIGSLRIWYGFIIGNNGGGGLMNMEDSTTYIARTPATRLPYDAIVGHEIAHSYISNESLTQFLEMYVYNVLRTGTANPDGWVFTRGYVPNDPSNQDSAALLGVYRLVGRDPMARAYRAAYPLRPPYGEPLSPAVRQTFVDQAPDALKSQVAALVARVTF